LLVVVRGKKTREKGKGTNENGSKRAAASKKPHCKVMDSRMHSFIS